MAPTPNDIPSLIEERRLLQIRLAELEATLAANSAAAPPLEATVLLSPEEAARRVGVSVDWLIRYGRTHRCAWLRKLGHKTVRIDSAGLTRWMATRRPS